MPNSEDKAKKPTKHARFVKALNLILAGVDVCVSGHFDDAEEKLLVDVAELVKVSGDLHAALGDARYSARKRLGMTKA